MGFADYLALGPFGLGLSLESEFSPAGHRSATGRAFGRSWLGAKRCRGQRGRWRQRIAAALVRSECGIPCMLASCQIALRPLSYLRLRMRLLLPASSQRNCAGPGGATMPAAEGKPHRRSRSQIHKGGGEQMQIQPGYGLSACQAAAVDLVIGNDTRAVIRALTHQPSQESSHALIGTLLSIARDASSPSGRFRLGAEVVRASTDRVTPSEKAQTLGVIAAGHGHDSPGLMPVQRQGMNSVARDPAAAPGGSCRAEASSANPYVIGIPQRCVAPHA